MLLEIYRLYGLDPTKPLVVTDTSRMVSGITQTINSTLASASGQANCAPSGVIAYGSIGSVSSSGDANQSPSGVGSISTVGNANAVVTDARYARPNVTVDAGNWVPSSGNSLTDMVNKNAPIDGNYISTTQPGSCVLKLGDVGPVNPTKQQVLIYQAWSSSGNGAIAYLMQDDLVIASWNHASLPTTPTVFTATLTQQQRSNITDYTKLKFKFEAL